MKDKLLNHFIGAMENRDEYQKQEIHKTLAFSGALMWVVTMLLMLYSFIMDTIHNTLSFITIALLIINMAYAFYVSLQMRKNHLDETDCASEEEYRARKKQLRKSSALVGLFWGSFMLFMMEYLFPYLESGSINVNWVNSLIWAVAAVIFGVVMYRIGKSKLNKPY